MPRYSLVSARDGDVLNEEAECADLETAELWASDLMIERFRLDRETFPTFEDVAPETDGCALEEVDPDPVAVAAVDLLDLVWKQLKLGSGPLLGRDAGTVECAAKAVKLASMSRTMAGRSIEVAAFSTSLSDCWPSPSRQGPHISTGIRTEP